MDSEPVPGEVKAPRTIETPRLRLTVPAAADAPEIFRRYAADPDVARYLSWPRHRSLDDTRAFVAFSDAEWARWPAGPYLIRDRATGHLLGGTGLGFVAPGEATTGYVLARDAWGRGFATEALGAMVALARRLEVTRLRAFCHPGHERSWRVLEKCGFVLDESWSEAAEFPNLAPGVPQAVRCYRLPLAAAAGAG